MDTIRPCCLLVSAAASKLSLRASVTIARLPDIASSGTSILLVDQDVDTALTVTERAYVLESGHVVLSGEASTLLADPRVKESYLGVV